LHIAEALDHANQQGFVHRDIKPENILFDSQGKPILTDFGIAKAMGSGTRMTATGMTIGTSHYMSPEQARGQEVDGRSDIYSLGVVFYEMLTGYIPYQAADSFAVALKHINDPVPQLPTGLFNLQGLLDRMMAKDPVGRYSHAGELVRDVRVILERGRRKTITSRHQEDRSFSPPVDRTKMIDASVYRRDVTLQKQKNHKGIFSIMSAELESKDKVGMLDIICISFLFVVHLAIVVIVIFGS
jgi:serine/threonine protein kinase